MQKAVKQYTLKLSGCVAWHLRQLQVVPSVQFTSVAQSCLTLWDPMDCSTPGFPVHHQLPELAQTHVHWISDAIQPSHPLSSLSPPAFKLSQNQGLFQWVSSSHQVNSKLHREKNERGIYNFTRSVPWYIEYSALDTFISKLFFSWILCLWPHGL